MSAKWTILAVQKMIQFDQSGEFMRTEPVKYM